MAVDDALEEDVEIAHASECVVVFEDDAGGSIGERATSDELLEAHEHPLHQRRGGLGVVAQGAKNLDGFVEHRLFAIGEVGYNVEIEGGVGIAVVVPFFEIVVEFDIVGGELEEPDVVVDGAFADAGL